MNSNLSPRRRAWLTVAGAATGVVLAAAIGGGLTYTLTDHHEVLVPATSEPTHVEPTTPEPTTPEPTSDPTSTELDKSDYDTTWLALTVVWADMSESDKADICTAVDMFGADWAAEQVGHGFNEDAIADFFTEKCGS